MMRALAAVFRKECVDNLRDRRTLLTVLVLGPLLGPMLYTGMMGISINRHIADQDQPIKLPVAGAGYAPNLVAFLQQHGVEIEAAPADPEQAVRDGKQDLVLVIPPDYPNAFRAGEPAAVTLVLDNSRDTADKEVNRTRALVEQYGRSVGALRLLARGVDPRALTPVELQEDDLSTPRSRSGQLLAMVPYFFLFAAILGAFYLAIDTTAGERERGSLEPLLATAAPRAALVLGKLAAVALFSSVSLGLDVAALWACHGLIPAEKLGIAIGFGGVTALAAFLLCLPFAPFAAALLSVVASFTRSYKEAQTWLSFIMLVPLVPVLALLLYPTPPAAWMMLLPSLSQDVLVTALIKGEPLQAGFVALSVASTLVFAGLLGALTVWRYRQEKILG